MREADPSAWVLSKGSISYGGPTATWLKGRPSAMCALSIVIIILLLIIKIVLFIPQLIIFLVFILLIINKIILFIAQIILLLYE